MQASLRDGLLSPPAMLRKPQTLQGIAAWTSLCLIGGIFVAGCNKTYGPNVAATVNGQPILRTEVNRYYRDNLGNPQQQPTQGQADATRLNILRQLIDDEILQQRAAKLHLVATDEEVDAKLSEWKAPYTQEEFDQKLKASNMSLDDLRKRIRVQLTQEKLLNKEIFSRIDITDADINKFYNTNKAAFNFIEPKYHIAEIVVTTQPTKMQEGANLQNSKASNDTEARKKIEMLHGRLQSGDDFASVAANYSESPNDASNGGDMGFIPESALHSDPNVFAAISKLKPGQMSDVVALTPPGSKTPSEYAIYKLLEREPAGQRQLNDPRVQQDIRQQLRDGRAQLLKAAYYEMLRDQSHIVNYLAEEIFKNGSR
ncbi:MAG TPA: SurA N-terminal domain-containing protein [Acidobacteriaceae bacterium]